MFDKLEKLRERPEKYRMRVALVISAAIAGVIFLIWLSVLGVRFKNDDNVATVKSSDSAFAEFREEFAGVYETGKQQFEEAKKELENIIQ